MTSMSRFDGVLTAVLTIALSSCAGVQKRAPSADSVLVKADTMLQMVENVTVEGIHRAYHLAELNCPDTASQITRDQCQQAYVAPWFAMLVALSSAQEALMYAYQVRTQGGDLANALACSREALTVLVRRLKDMKTNPPSEFAVFVVDVIRAAEGGVCRGPL